MIRTNSSSSDSGLDDLEMKLKRIVFSPEMLPPIPDTSTQMHSAEKTAPEATVESAIEKSTYEGFEEIPSPIPDVPQTQIPDVPIPEVTAQLTEALLRYATHSSRLLFIEHTETWRGFYFEREENAEKYGEYTPEELCMAFVYKVLPRLDELDLTEERKHLLRLLNLHPQFERTTKGYSFRAPADRVASTHQPKHNIDFCLVTQTDADQIFKIDKENTDMTMAEFEFDTKRSKPAPVQNIVTLHPVQNLQTGKNFKFSKENAALISAVLSNDYELSNCALLDPDEMLRRLREAKRTFEKTGRMNPNVMDVQMLLKKMEKLNKLRETIAEITLKEFL